MTEVVDEKVERCVCWGGGGHVKTAYQDLGTWGRGGEGRGFPVTSMAWLLRWDGEQLSTRLL